MYNGIGLPTPRGSGTSGYVQKNLAYVKKTKGKIEFQMELEAIKANPPKPPKTPNKEILEHEQKRQIEIQLIRFKEKMQEEGADSKDIQKKIEKIRKFLHSKLADAPLISESTSHSKIFKKTEEIKKLEEALGIKKDYVPGSGFDFEAIEQERKSKKPQKKPKLDKE